LCLLSANKNPKIYSWGVMAGVEVDSRAAGETDGDNIGDGSGVATGISKREFF
jgi:hypothetical protein